MVRELLILVTLRNKIKVALRDELQGYFMCVPLVGFEPTTILSVKKVLYPLSYSGTQFGI